VVFYGFLIEQASKSVVGCLLEASRGETFSFPVLPSLCFSLNGPADSEKTRGFKTSGHGTLLRGWRRIQKPNLNSELYVKERGKY
jgi:hypothetical protein